MDVIQRTFGVDEFDQPVAVTLHQLFLQLRQIVRHDGRVLMLLRFQQRDDGIQRGAGELLRHDFRLVDEFLQCGGKLRGQRADRHTQVVRRRQRQFDAAYPRIVHQQWVQVIEIFRDEKGGQAMLGQLAVRAPVANEHGHGIQVVTPSAAGIGGDQIGRFDHAADLMLRASQARHIGGIAKVLRERFNGGARRFRQRLRVLKTRATG